MGPMLMSHGVNAYMFGHDHLLQFIEHGQVQHIGSGAGHGCRDDFDNINSEKNPGLDALKFMDCNQGGFVRLSIDTRKAQMQCFYYTSNSPDVQFFSGVWHKDGAYTTIDDLMYGTTLTPTFQPTVEPTVHPTAQPTTEPTQVPTMEPTEQPSEMPTHAPTNEPTATPSDMPTRTPTMEPTAEPSLEPMLDPTVEPTLRGGDSGDGGGDAGEKQQHFVVKYKWVFIGGGGLIVLLVLVLFVVNKRRETMYVKSDDGYRSLLEEDPKGNTTKRAGSMMELQTSMRN